MAVNLDLIRGRQQVIPMINKSGGALAEGDVVVVDETTDDAFTTTNDEGKKEVVGVVAETIANNAEGRVICSGYVPVLEVDAATARGDWLKTANADPGKATPTADPAEGSFAVALSTVGAAGQVSAFVFPGGAAILTGGAWNLIEDIKLGAPAATIDFQNIPATYKYLVLLYSIRSDRAASTVGTIGMRFNNSNAGYDWTRIDRAGSAEGLNGTEIQVYNIPASGSPAGAFGVGTIFVYDYLDTGKMTSDELTGGGFVRTQVAANIFAGTSHGTWRTLDAVDRITLFPMFGPNFVADSRATLYGIS